MTTNNQLGDANELAKPMSKFEIETRIAVILADMRIGAAYADMETHHRDGWSMDYAGQQRMLYAEVMRLLALHKDLP